MVLKVSNIADIMDFIFYVLITNVERIYFLYLSEKKQTDICSLNISGRLVQSLMNQQWPKALSF